MELDSVVVGEVGLGGDCGLIADGVADVAFEQIGARAGVFEGGDEGFAEVFGGQQQSRGGEAGGHIMPQAGLVHRALAVAVEKEGGREQGFEAAGDFRGEGDGADGGIVFGLALSDVEDGRRDVQVGGQDAQDFGGAESGEAAEQDDGGGAGEGESGGGIVEIERFSGHDGVELFAGDGAELERAAGVRGGRGGFEHAGDGAGLRGMAARIGEGAGFVGLQAHLAGFSGVRGPEADGEALRGFPGGWHNEFTIDSYRGRRP